MAKKKKKKKKLKTQFTLKHFTALNNCTTLRLVQFIFATVYYIHTHKWEDVGACFPLMYCKSFMLIIYNNEGWLPLIFISTEAKDKNLQFWKINTVSGALKQFIFI